MAIVQGFRYFATQGRGWVRESVAFDGVRQELVVGQQVEICCPALLSAVGKDESFGAFYLARGVDEDESNFIKVGSTCLGTEKQGNVKGVFLSKEIDMDAMTLAQLRYGGRVMVGSKFADVDTKNLAFWCEVREILSAEWSETAPQTERRLQDALETAAKHAGRVEGKSIGRVAKAGQSLQELRIHYNSDGQLKAIQLEYARIVEALRSSRAINR